MGADQPVGRPVGRSRAGLGAVSARFAVHSLATALSGLPVLHLNTEDFRHGLLGCPRDRVAPRSKKVAFPSKLPANPRDRLSASAEARPARMGQARGAGFDCLDLRRRAGDEASPCSLERQPAVRSCSCGRTGLSRGRTARPPCDSASRLSPAWSGPAAPPSKAERWPPTGATRRSWARGGLTQ